MMNSGDFDAKAEPGKDVVTVRYSLSSEGGTNGIAGFQTGPQTETEVSSAGIILVVVALAGMCFILFKLLKSKATEKGIEDPEAQQDMPLHKALMEIFSKDMLARAKNKDESHKDGDDDTKGCTPTASPDRKSHWAQQEKFTTLTENDAVEVVAPDASVFAAGRKSAEKAGLRSTLSMWIGGKTYREARGKPNSTELLPLDTELGATTEEETSRPVVRPQTAFGEQYVEIELAETSPSRSNLGPVERPKTGWKDMAHAIIAKRKQKNEAFKMSAQHEEEDITIVPPPPATFSPRELLALASLSHKDTSVALNRSGPFNAWSPRKKRTPLSAKEDELTPLAPPAIKKAPSDEESSVHDAVTETTLPEDLGTDKCAPDHTTSKKNRAAPDSPSAVEIINDLRNQEKRLSKSKTP